MASAERRSAPANACAHAAAVSAWWVEAAATAGRCGPE